MGVEFAIADDAESVDHLAVGIAPDKMQFMRGSPMPKGVEHMFCEFGCLAVDKILPG